MGNKKNNSRISAVEHDDTPPSALTDTQFIARIALLNAHAALTCTLPSGESVIVELPSKYIGRVWLKRGGYVVVDSAEVAARDNKIAGLVVNVIREEKAWRKMPYWPKEFVKKSLWEEESDGEEELDDDDEEKEGQK